VPFQGAATVGIQILDFLDYERDVLILVAEASKG
jgi:hypothetical protein